MKTRWLYAGAVVLLALTSGTLMAQGRGNGNGQNRGQARKADRQAAARFADHDRQSANQWYASNRGALPRGMRDSDRLPAEQQARVSRGYVIDRNMRARMYPAPYALVRTFTPAPYGYRYLVYGGQVVLVDDGYQVADVISLNFTFGN